VSYPHPGAPVPYGTPAPLPAPKYRPLRLTAIVSIVLMALTSVAAVIQCVLLWSSYEDVKRFVFGLLSEDEIDRGVQSIAGAGPLLNLVSYLFLGTAVAFIIWLWRARENSEILTPTHQQPLVYQGAYPVVNQPEGPHRHAQGWVVGGWFCPIVQFWYPLQVVQDVVRASEPAPAPGAAKSGGLKRLLYGWWGAWTAFWVILVGGGGVAVLSFFVWIIRLVDAADTADATGDYVDIYDLQDFMVRVALGINIGFTVATVLLIGAGVMVSVVLLRVTGWQDERGRTSPGQSPSRFQYGPPYGAPHAPPYGQSYGQSYGHQPPPPYGPMHSQQVGSGQPSTPPAQPSFPSYGGYPGGRHQQPPGGSPPRQRPG
jgi:hypothetical protein